MVVEEASVDNSDVGSGDVKRNCFISRNLKFNQYEFTGQI